MAKNKKINREVGEKIYFTTQTNSREKKTGTIIGVYDNFFLVQTPFGYRTTVSRAFVVDEDEEKKIKKNIAS